MTCVGDSRACGAGEPCPGPALCLLGDPCLALKEAAATAPPAGPLPLRPRPGPRGAHAGPPRPRAPPHHARTQGARLKVSAAATEQPQGGPGQRPSVPPPPGVSVSCPSARRWQEHGLMDVAAAGPPRGSGRPRGAGAGDTRWPFPGSPGHGDGLPKALLAPVHTPAALAASRPVPGKLAESSRVSQKRDDLRGPLPPPRGQSYLQVFTERSPQTLGVLCASLRPNSCGLAAWRGRESPIGAVFHGPRSTKIGAA